MNIDELIEKSKSMPNISDGGSPAYSFGDKVLVKYAVKNKYGDAREMEEAVQVAVNNKNQKGVNTPRHLAIKRIVEGEDNYCYVLQEKAPGESFIKFYSGKNSPVEQLKKQQELLDIPLEHFIKLAKDYGELFHMGLEPQAKNIFYDKEKGFTIIDFLDSDESGIDYDSMPDIIYLKSLMECLSNITLIYDYRCDDKEIVQKSRELYNALEAKIYLAMKEVIPENKRRFLLRSYDKDKLEYFYKENIISEDLTLNDEEILEIDKMLESIIKDSYEKLYSGEFQLWQIELNEIRIALTCNGVLDSYMYNPNSKFNRDEFKSDIEYQEAIQDYLTDYCLTRIYELVMNASPDNVYIVNVQAEIEGKKQLSN